MVVLKVRWREENTIHVLSNHVEKKLPSAELSMLMKEPVCVE